MFIKLSYNANTNITVPFRFLQDIITTSSITSVSALQSRFTSANYHATLTANFDAANSTIIRTVDPTNTKAHFSYWQRPDYNDFEFTMEQPTYDASASKIYSQVRQYTSNAQTVFFDVGTAITGGTITASSTPVTYTENSTTSNGTLLTLGGNNYGNQTVNLNGTSGFTAVRTFWAYVTDKCFFWAVTNGTSYNSGWGSTYATTTAFSGPFFQTQYTRYDYHNTDSNGICPVLWTNQRGASVGFGTVNDISTVQNINYTSNTTTIPLRVNGIVSALPQVGTAWPKIYNPQVQLTIAGRSSANFGANVGQVAGTTTNPALASYAGSISTAASTRYPNSTLTATGFGLMPFGWEANYYGNHGGNATDQCGVYIFNGDYAPGDTFTYNSTTYMVWPLYSGYSNRVGLAVPMV